jgi:hypothetical protein
MSEPHLGPLEVDCDAPLYSIVRATRQLGINRPEDVRWCHMKNLGRQSPWQHFLSSVSQARGSTCSCGEPLPVMDLCRFTLSSGDQVSYLLGQCRRCDTVFWERS